MASKAPDNAPLDWIQSMKLRSGMAVVLRKKDKDQSPCGAIVRFTSHKGQALELQFDQGGSLVLFRDEKRDWQDPTGSHWELHLAPPTRRLNGPSDSSLAPMTQKAAASPPTLLDETRRDRHLRRNETLPAVALATHLVKPLLGRAWSTRPWDLEIPASSTPPTKIDCIKIASAKANYGKLM